MAKRKEETPGGEFYTGWIKEASDEQLSRFELDWGYSEVNVNTDYARTLLPLVRVEMMERGLSTFADRVNSNLDEVINKTARLSQGEDKGLTE